MCSTRKGVRVTKYLLAGVTVFCVSWIACVNEWSARSHWNPPQRRFSTMKTIIAYSEGKQAEMDRPSPVACDRLPDYPFIPELNRTWSPHAAEALWQGVKGTRVSLYAAYYDERAPQHYVRILAIFHGRNLSSLEDLYCQTRFQHDGEDSVEVVAAKPLEIWWQDWDKSTKDVDTPCLLSCPLTEPLNYRAQVSIVTEPCDNPTNGFQISPKINANYHRSFTVCVKDMNFEKDISSTLIEWIETNRILGADIIDFYIDRVNKNTEATLLRYQSAGFVRLFQVPIKNTARSLWQRRRDHLVSYNDCLYRNILESEFIVPLDVDEVLVPKKAYNWHGLLKRLPRHGWDPHHHSAILVRNVFFFDFMQHLYNSDITSDNINRDIFYMKRDDVRLVMNRVRDDEGGNMQTTEMERDENDCERKLNVPKLSRHIVSSATISPVGYYSKSFMLTRKVLVAFNHYPLASIGATGFTGWAAPHKEVQLNHYKETCNITMVPECAQYVLRSHIDRSALHLSRRLVRAIANTVCK